MTKKILLALDVGTSSTLRCSVRRRYGGSDSRCGRVDRTSSDIDGGWWFDPGSRPQVVAECIECLAAAAAHTGSAAEVAGGRRLLFLALLRRRRCLEGAADADPDVVRSSIGASAGKSALRGEIDAAAYTARTGCPLHASYPFGRLLWLHDTQPDVWAKCARFLSPAEFFFSQLFGLDRTTISTSMASGTGLLDQRRGSLGYHRPCGTAWRCRRIGCPPFPMRPSGESGRPTGIGWRS